MTNQIKSLKRPNPLPDKALVDNKELDKILIEAMLKNARIEGKIVLVTRFNAGSTIELINPSRVSPRHRGVEILILDRTGGAINLSGEWHPQWLNANPTPLGKCPNIPNIGHFRCEKCVRAN